jgi:hypothetical protein
MNRISEEAASATRPEAMKSTLMLTLLAGGLHGLVVGFQIAFLAIQGAIPASWLGPFTAGSPAYQTFAMISGALVGTIVAVVVIMIKEQRANR